MSQWQSVETALPAEGARCIVRLKNGKVFEAERSRAWTGGWGVIASITKKHTTISGRSDVTDWIPYPQSR